MNWIILFTSLTLMILGADWLIRGCTHLAHRIAISEFIVSFFIIGFGTSAPEMIVSVISSLNNQSGLVIGNAIASNTINILGILGIGALLYPITTNGKKRKTDVAFLFISAIAMLYSVSDGTVSRFEGIILLSIFIAYVLFLKNKNEFKQNKPVKIHTLKIVIPVITGLISLYLGSEYFMHALNDIISKYQINETIAGVLIVAPGTSSPELLVTILAALKKRPSIALGNILGSCLTNLSVVVGASAIIGPLFVSNHILSLDIWVMIFATSILSWQLLNTEKLSKFTGIMYLLILIGYFILV